MQICNFTRNKCCEGLTFAQQNIKVVKISPLYRCEGNNCVDLYLRKECATKRINFHKNVLLQSSRIWPIHQKLFQGKTRVNLFQIFISQTSVPCSVILLLVQLMFLFWNEFLTQTEKEIESTSSFKILVKQKLLSLYNEFLKTCSHKWKATILNMRLLYDLMYGI